MRILFFGEFALVLTFSLPLAAQGTPGTSTPTITTSATGEVRRAPDHAVVAVGVQTLNATATEAAAAMNEAIASIVDTLAGLGIPPESLPTRRFAVQPQYSYEGERRLIGYGAQTSVSVTVRDLARVGEFIDAVLGAGANDIQGVQFGIFDNRTARDEALRLAVREARRDAEALADGAGGSLGALVRLGTGRAMYGVEAMSGVVARAGAIREGALITPDDVVVRETVTASWRFVARN